MSRMAKTKELTAEDLADEGASITRAMDSMRASLAAMVEERREVWRRAEALGMSRTKLAQRAGLHHSQVDKALNA